MAEDTSGDPARQAVFTLKALSLPTVDDDNTGFAAIEKSGCYVKYTEARNSGTDNEPKIEEPEVVVIRTGC